MREFASKFACYMGKATEIRDKMTAHGTRVSEGGGLDGLLRAEGFVPWEKSADAFVVPSAPEATAPL